MFVVRYWLAGLTTRSAGRNLAMLVAVLAGVFLLEAATRVLIAETLSPRDSIEVAGPLFLTRADHYDGIDASLLWRYPLALLALPLVIRGIAVLPFLRDWTVIALGLLLGGSFANAWFSATSGYVANWIALGEPGRAMVYVPADFAQIAAAAMAAVLVVFVLVWALLPDAGDAPSTAPSRP